MVLGATVAGSIAVCVLLVSMGWVGPELLGELRARPGWQAAGLYVAAAVTMELLWLPRMWVLISAGALFGPWLGLALSMVADTISAALCYGLARGSGKAWVEGQVARRPRAQRVMELLAHRRGGTTLAVLRMTPVAHYTLTSYVAGLTGVAVLPFFVGNTVGLLPGAAIYVVVGDGALHAPTSPMFIAAVVVLGLAFVVTAVVGRRLLRR